MKIHPGTILVVDGDQVNRLLLYALLEEQGHTVLTAPNGRRALEVLAARPVDAVLLDLIMPEMDGFQVLAHLKGDPALAHIPVIVVSAVDEMDSVIRCVEMGAADHLVKPVDPVFLRARLSASLAAKRLRDQEQEYLQQVAQLTAAANQVQRNRFDPASLALVAARPDELGTLARVFSHMVRELHARQQHLEAQNRVKSAFIGRMTHELRSPFVAAGFSIELLRRYHQHGMGDQLGEQIERLDRDLAAGRRLIDEMITFASLVGRNSKLNLEPTGVADLIHGATAHLQALAASRSISLSYNISPGLPPIVVDTRHLGEAIAHLVHNAIKFNHEGGRVLITAWMVDDNLALKVTDTGCGIPPEKINQLWDPFEQAAHDERRGVEGLGLGLALVKQVIALHGGEVVVSSRPDQGSTFGFRIPARIAAPALA